MKKEAKLPITLTSLFFQLFARCIRGYELIGDACRREDNAQALLVKFKIEEHRLLNWGKVVQLDHTDEQLLLDRMSKGMILNILVQQRNLRTSFGRINNECGTSRTPLLQEQKEAFVIHSDHSIENGDSVSEESKKFLQFPPAEELVIKAFNWLKKVKDVPKSVRWASWDHERMDELIRQLSGFNDNMHQALNKAQMETMHVMQTQFHYQMILLNSKMDNLVQIWQSCDIACRPTGHITDPEYSEYDSANSIVPSKTGRLTKHLSALAQQKFILLAIEVSQVISGEYGNSIGLPHLAHNIRGTVLLLNDICTKDNHPFPEHVGDSYKEQRTETSYDGVSVWIEWKRNEMAAKLKQDNRKVNFCAPHCLGYIIDESGTYELRLGLVFEKPTNLPHDAQLTTLSNCIEEVQAGRSGIPSLTDRIVLMLRPAETVERLHAVDWLHKGLRSANILFFQSQQTPSGNLEVNYANPYISGFDYSHPAMNDDMTERPTDNPRADIYGHPHVQSTGNREESSGRESYKKSFDIYSLGIVLLEIAYWKTIDQILGVDMETARPKQTWPVRQRLLKEEAHLKGMRSAVGNTVEGMIRACLEGPEAFDLPKDCDERRGIVAAVLQRDLGTWLLGHSERLKDCKSHVLRLPSSAVDPYYLGSHPSITQCIIYSILTLVNLNERFGAFHRPDRLESPICRITMCLSCLDNLVVVQVRPW